MKKDVCRILKRNNLLIIITPNAKSVNFLDVHLDLRTGLYKPYKKENDNLVDVSRNTNHPPQVLENIPYGVNRRLSKISTSREVFGDMI